ncbi:hypothetical protein MKW94_007453 [Papaver nudicaule]|uniref:Uncharacterized protein n=1 Tax=Papaver nudicaule TaxID=74823 RepID=A0AA41RZZ0_PAPNU|nr:hypothetical protein [Papaver nudicaule]MCL7029006.1 hypothetical protein [Papaver nudicaule]
MAGKVCMVFFILAMVCLIAGSSASSSDVVVGVARSSTQTCNGLVGDCISGENELMVDSRIHRRLLFHPKEHISRDRTGRRGKSDCHKPYEANPYRRGCTALTHCKRIIR